MVLYPSFLQTAEMCVLCMRRHHAWLPFFMNSKSDEKNSFDVLIIFFFRTDKKNVTIAQILTNSIFTKKRKINILDSDIIFINKSTIYLFINKRNTDAKIKMLFTFGFFFICQETIIFNLLFNLYSPIVMIIIVSVIVKLKVVIKSYIHSILKDIKYLLPDTFSILHQ